MKRHIIIHYHLYKNAGSTLDFILESHFNKNWLSYDPPNRAIGSLRPLEIVECAADRPNLQAISTHLAKVSPPKSDDCCYYPLVFLRHPLDRIGSVYAYLRTLPIEDEREHVLMAKKYSSADFIRWRLDARFGALIRNFQTAMLCNDHINLTYKVATSKDLDEAKCNISALAFFGLVEHFDDSINAMKAYLRPQFGEIVSDYRIQNKNSERGASLNNRLDELKQALGSSLYDELERANALDLELYQHAEQSFLNRGF